MKRKPMPSIEIVNKLCAIAGSGCRTNPEVAVRLLTPLKALPKWCEAAHGACGKGRRRK